MTVVRQIFSPRPILVSAFAFVTLCAAAQIPTKCLEIESILVDACNPGNLCPGASEGLNEMVRFITGPQATALTDISVNWPNNAWQGLVQNSTTAALTAELNATVESCGLLLEPLNGIILPGSTVILATSAALCTAANPFTNLGDTIYIIYQSGNNVAGHFANNPAAGSAISPTPPSGSSFRQLIITYTPTGCSDTAIYQRELLVNHLGSYGGTMGESDGGTVLFSWPGVPQATYVNYGCQAPIENTGVDVTGSGNLCGGGTVTLSANATGPFISGYWTGGTGTFSSPSTTTTDYTAGPGETGNIALQYCVVGLCGADTVCGTLIVAGGTTPTITITPNGPTAICPGDNLLLTATGATSYLWSNGETTAAINVNLSGTYTVTGTNACGSASNSIQITQSNGPVVVITPSGPPSLCAGEMLTLSATGANTYLWSSGETTPSISIMFPGNYTVNGTNSCGTSQSLINITAGQPPIISIANSGTNVICSGQTVTLTASGADTYSWNTGANTASITVQNGGSYTVTGTNACGQGMVSTTITEVSLNSAFTANIVTGLAPLNVVFTNTTQPSTATSAWLFGDGSSSSTNSPVHTFSSPGTYTVVLTSTSQGCTGTSSQVITVLSVPVATSTIVVPNVFTPNGDSENSVFDIQTVGIVAMNVHIYNRWGQLMYEIKDTQQVWDARSQAGDVVPEGTYFYALTAKGADGVDHKLNGSITVLR